MAVIISFPKMEKALRKDKKNIKLFYEKGIVVMNQVAFAFKANMIFAVNLKDFFTIEKSIDNEDEIKDINKLLFFLEQKVFSKEYWEELTNISEMKILEGNIHIENPKYSKSLVYKEEDNDFRGLLELIEELNGYSEIDAESLSFAIEDLLSIFAVYSSEFKKDTICFTAVENGYTKFTFKNRKHFYGFIQNKETFSNDPFKFEQMKTDLKEVSALKELYPEKPSGPPPPKTNVEND